MRVYVGPATIDSGGSENGAVRVDTGTMVVWRNIRISRYVQQPAGAPAAVILDPLRTGAADREADAVNTVDDYLKNAEVVNQAGVNVGIANADFVETVKGDDKNVGQLGGGFDRLIAQFARGFCELTVDQNAQLPETLTQEEWQNARQRAIKDGKKGMRDYGMRMDLNKLFHMDTAGITVNNAVTHLPMREPGEYNALFRAGSRKRFGVGQNTRVNVGDLFLCYIAPGFLRALTKNGYLPGLTVVQGAFGCGWQLLWNSPGAPVTPWSYIDAYTGLATAYRGAYVWSGAATYPKKIRRTGESDPAWPDAWQSYDYTSNTIHELGHCLYRRHADGEASAGGMVPAQHDPLADCICVMSYKSCEGQFCAKCLLALRGWDITSLNET